ncbi:MAG TPA: hypothetical protein VNL98_08970 [Gemmatimonadales bacterium]|nr:hypothetical protein [Gemmatimonadales bacterium]
MKLNRPLVLAGVFAYSLLVAVLRWYGVIGDRGALLLYGLMVVDLVASHWLLERRSRRPPDEG